MTFRIYYGNGSVISSNNKADWLNSPNNNVQVVVDLSYKGPTGWHYIPDNKPISVHDRKLWTGQDEYDPFGWGVKYSKLIETKTYFEIWNRACGDR